MQSWPLAAHRGCVRAVKDGVPDAGAWERALAHVNAARVGSTARVQRTARFGVSLGPQFTSIKGPLQNAEVGPCSVAEAVFT